MLNADPNQAGIHRGRNVPTHPNSLNSTNIGTISTGNGIIMVARVIPKNMFRPGHRSRANP